MLYNWYSIEDCNNIAPEGWHVPTDEEWKQLEIFLGMSQSEADDWGYRGTDEGGKLKEAGTSHWKSPNTGATNQSGFSALAGGARDMAGEFGSTSYGAFFWSSTEADSVNSWCRYLHYDQSDVTRDLGGASKFCGFSVRCVKD